MNNFVKAIDKGDEGIKHLKERFAQLSEAKRKEGIFTGADVRKVIVDPTFEGNLNQRELAAWKSFVKRFLGNKI